MKEIKRPGLEAIESFFKMPFVDVINILHHEKKLSIKYLSDQCGISRDTFQKQAKRLGLKLRNSKEACSLTKNKGALHWGYGKNKYTCEVYKRHSERMTLNNPSKDEKILNKSSLSLSLFFKSHPLPQELKFINILDSLSVLYIFQYVIGKYIIDFFIPSINLCIEIDSTDKWDKNKKERSFIKDQYLLNNGYKILRICRTKLDDSEFIKNILLTNNVICNQ